jgi:hypothetical protein
MENNQLNPNKNYLLFFTHCVDNWEQINYMHRYVMQ